jgi:hypothetical protein
MQSGIKSFFTPVSAPQYKAQVQRTLDEHAAEYEQPAEALGIEEHVGDTDSKGEEDREEEEEALAD